MARELKPYEAAIAKTQDEFAKSADGLIFDNEKIFALQALTKTDFAMQVANKNPLSVRLAMLNLAATGLTLNPAYHYAYLLPRDGAIVLEISYRGILKIAIDAGAILWGRAEVVYERDSFTYRGPAREPEHTANPFATDRGEIVGAYCIVKTPSGDVLTEVIARDELEKIRAKSDLFARKKSGPWVEWFSEMCRKAVVKRAAKTWPSSDRMSRVLDAIEMANASEGGYTLDAQPTLTVTDQQAAHLSDLIEAAGVDAGEFLSLFNVERVDALPRFRLNEAISLLRSRCVTNSKSLVKENS